MKTRTDPRHTRRAKIVQQLFAQSFRTQSAQPQTLLVMQSLPHIDPVIAKAAPLWPLDKIAKVDLAVLRLAVYELLVDKKEPEKVVIDEAVELAKEFGGEASASFINGVLGTILKQMKERHE